MYYCFRLHCGDDLKQSIYNYCKNKNIRAAAVVTAVGCLYQAHIRLADGKTERTCLQRLEIVSLTGTISRNGCHLHISMADELGNVIGGHLCEESYVNSTCEVVLVDLSDEYSFQRVFDELTGYRELDIKKRH